MLQCFEKVKSQVPGTIIESRMDNAFFNQNIISLLAEKRVKFTAPVPFARFAELKTMIEDCNSWQDIDNKCSYFETQWKPKSWNTEFRFVFIKKEVKKNHKKGLSKLDLFEPLDLNYEYKVIMTNKTESAKSVVLFHNSRESQESIFGDAKTDTALGVIPCKRLSSNQVFTLASMVVHPAITRAKPKRPTAWKFKKLDTMRHQIIQRAGRLTRPQGKLPLTMGINPTVKKDLLHFMDVLQKTA